VAVTGHEGFSRVLIWLKALRPVHMPEWLKKEKESAINSLLF
jgi:hypothetical protein